MISLIGAAMILIAVSNLALYYFGETATAGVTTRRVGGSDDSRPPDQRYEWSIDYTFQDKNGATRSGHTSRRGNDLSVKTDSRIFYFSFAPYINALQSEAQPNMGQPVLIVIGGFLIYVMNRKRNLLYI